MSKKRPFRGPTAVSRGYNAYDRSRRQFENLRLNRLADEARYQREIEL